MRKLAGSSLASVLTSIWDGNLCVNVSSAACVIVLSIGSRYRPFNTSPGCGEACIVSSFSLPSCLIVIYVINIRYVFIGKAEDTAVISCCLFPKPASAPSGGYHHDINHGFQLNIFRIAFNMPLTWPVCSGKSKMAFSISRKSYVKSGQSDCCPL